MTLSFSGAVATTSNPMAARLLATATESPDGCWLWLGRSWQGWGRVTGRSLWVHRVAYEIWIGPIPAGFQVDHLCRVRNCFNPAHLEAVTQYVNNMRSDSPSAVAARKTHCKWGHEFTPENTWTQQATGHRWCRACLRRRKVERATRLAGAA